MAESDDRGFQARAVETSVRIALVAMLLVWCFLVVRPFVQPAVWGVIIAIAAYPAYERFSRALGGRQGLAAVSIVAGTLLLLAVPSVLITTSLVESAAGLAQQLNHGDLRVPPPPETVAAWPLIGEPLHEFWETASHNLEAALAEVRPLLLSMGRGALASGASAGMGILMFALAIVIAGALLSYGEQAADAARKIALRLAPQRGDDLLALTRNTVKSVTIGILGVALIQAFLAGIGLLVAGVPGAGLWALLVLLCAVVQIPTALVLGPVAVYVFATASTGLAILFAVWSAAVSLSDNVLKPVLLGRSAPVPTLVIFLGAIGGFILQGIIGLFTGAVVLAVGFSLFRAWLEEAPAS